jgi:hypothetical protein
MSQQGSAPPPTKSSDAKQPPEERKSGRNNHRRFKQQQQQPSTKVIVKLTNCHDKLIGHHFDCGNTKQSELYDKTSLAIASYAAEALSNDIYYVITELKLPTLTGPADITNPATQAELIRYKSKVDLWTKREEKLERDMERLYPLVWDQCSPALQDKLKALPLYNTFKAARDSLTLLKEVKKLSYMYTDGKSELYNIDEAKHRYWHCRMTRQQTIQEYATEFESAIAVIKHSGATISAEAKTIAAYALANNTTVDALTDSQRELVDEQEHTMRFFKSLDRARFGKLMDATSNANLVGRDEYPTTISAATTLLRGYTNDNAGQQQSGATNDGINFAMHTSQVTQHG